MLKKPMLKLIEAIETTGLTIVSDKGHGKTNALMCIVASMKNYKHIPILIDYATQHCFKLGFEVKFLNKNYLIKKPTIKIKNPIIIDVS